MTSLARHRTWYRRALDPRPEGWLEVAVAVVLSVIYAAMLLGTVDDLGYARDEGFYFHAARAYQAWFELLARDFDGALAAVDAHWRVNREHPSLIKSLFALSHWLLWDRHRLLSLEGTSYRLVGIAISSGAVGLVYLWGVRVQGRLCGLVAAGALASMPRFFYHAHLACFDAPVVTMWLACAYAWWRALGRGGAWRYVLVGLTFGLALDTKHNAWFIPIVCAVHGVALLLVERSPDHKRLLAHRAGASGFSMVTLGPLVMVSLWPWVWHDTAARLWDYAQFHLGHVYYNMEFLGDNYWRPPMPRSYAFVMTAATVPGVTLVATSVGLWAAARRCVRHLLARRTSPSTTSVSATAPLFWSIAIAVQYGAWLLPSTPIFGGTKHWMTAYPFVALFAGLGAAELCRWARLRAHRRPSLRSWLAAPSLEGVMIIGLLLGPAAQTARSHPWGLSFYTPLVGGAAGGASLGLNRGFWGYTTGAPAILRYLDREAPARARVYLHDTAPSAWDMMIRDGRVRPDLRGVLDLGRSDVALYHHEKHMRGVMYQAWVVFGTTAPSTIAGLAGVPVVWAYAPARPSRE